MHGIPNGSVLPALFLRDQYFAAPPSVPVGPVLQLPRQFPKPTPHAVCFDILESSPRPPRPCRRCGEPACQASASGNPLAIPCQSARGISKARSSSFAFACNTVWSFAEPFLTLLGSCISGHVLVLLSVRCSRPRAPSLRRHYPASSVIQASPPPRPARPVPRGIPVGACHTTDGASRVALLFPLSCMPAANTPAGAAQCVPSLSSRPPCRSSPFPTAGSTPTLHTFRGLLGVLWTVPRYALHEAQPFVEPWPSRVSAAHNGLCLQ